MQITSIYTDSDGDSRFRDIEVPLQDHGTIGSLSDRIAVDAIVFREVEPNYDFDFHNAPERQYIILLDGEIEIETSLGEKRHFSGGDILLVEDVTGKGHKTRNITPVRRRSIFIPLRKK